MHCNPQKSQRIAVRTRDTEVGVTHPNTWDPEGDGLYGGLAQTQSTSNLYISHITQGFWKERETLMTEQLFRERRFQSSGHSS